MASKSMESPEDLSAEAELVSVWEWGVAVWVLVPVA
jgi:hypothetical protein